METFTVSREDDIYEAFPDVALTDDGRLVCVYAECTHHGDRSYTRVVVRTSDDRGRTWSGKRTLAEPRYKEERADPNWNCPRVSVAGDRLVAVVDLVGGDAGDRTAESNWLWESTDGGETWDGPRETPVVGIVPDQVVELEAEEHVGRWVLGAHTVDADGDGRLWRQRVWTSDDRGGSWAGPFEVAAERGLQLCEGSVVELDDGTLACFMRENSGTGKDAYKALSRDGGHTWVGPDRFPLPACHRPVAGTLGSGRVLVTHRFMQGGSGWLGAWTQNTFAALTDQESCRARSRGEAGTRIRPLDYDRSPVADTGYTGWAQFDDGEIYVVNYIVDDAPATPVREPPDYDGEYADVPRSYLRGYSLTEDEFRLDGD